MDLPLRPPVAPMLARAVPALPEGDFSYEPKYDGFRCVVFRDGSEVELSSRSGRPLTRYFPELAEAFRRELPERCVLDGEVVVRRGGRLDFEALAQRVHPAASRIALLSRETPASYVAFDLLALDGESLLELPFAERRARLARALGAARPPVHLTTITASREEALRWFDRFEGAGLDGVVAKPVDAPYTPGARTMFKVKHERTADCVVGGYRWHKSGPVVGSLLLGLWDDGGLQFVGVAAAFPMALRRSLVELLAPYRMPGLAGHPWASWATQGEEERMPGAVSRWTGKKDLSWVPLRPELVCEVAYDHLEGRRFRHNVQFRRWRTDRTPESCGYAQLERPAGYDLDRILG
ncbi:ATP-dependent DNA ligase [Actinocorallia libanotica]|uniref:DNA ligase (ATP) n=1 Tax=Actinocorallia libanotica TaxID=46162 RepID=A0ABN1QDG7_9ACTN